MARLSASQAGGVRVLAFLDTIAFSEIGAALRAASDDGYNVIVGSTPAHPHLFASYADHPRVFVSLSATLRSSAAGRYQFLARTWDALVKQLSLADFSPENQDRGAIQLIRECGALANIADSRAERAIEQCAPIWASFPGAGYGQPEQSMPRLLGAYHAALAAYPPDFGNVTSGSATTT